MQFKSLVALAASVATAAAQATCHSYVIISIRGTYEVQGPSIAFYGMINSTLKAVPGGVEYDAVYPAAVNQTAYLGADDVRRYIDEGLQDCPNQKYAILGYSQGASATKLTLGNYTDTSSAAYKAIKAVLVVGDPYHVPNASVNVDENGGDLTKSYPGTFYNANSPDGQGISDAYYSKLLDICHTEDVVCAPAYPNASFSPGHLMYGDQDVQDLGSKFLIPLLSGISSNGTSSNGSSSTATGTGVVPRPTGGIYPTGTKPNGTAAPTGTGSISTPSASLLPPGASSSAGNAIGLSMAVYAALAGLMLLSLGM